MREDSKLEKKRKKLIFSDQQLALENDRMLCGPYFCFHYSEKCLHRITDKDLPKCFNWERPYIQQSYSETRILYRDGRPHEVTISVKFEENGNKNTVIVIEPLGD